jgi:hypothetical protein
LSIIGKIRTEANIRGRVAVGGQVSLGKSPPPISHPNQSGRGRLTQCITSPAIPHRRQKKQGRTRPCLEVSVVGVTGYGRNILLRPTSPKPNRPGPAHNNTLPPDTRLPKRCVTGWAGFFMGVIIAYSKRNWQAFSCRPPKFFRTASDGCHLRVFQPAHNQKGAMPSSMAPFLHNPVGLQPPHRPLPFAVLRGGRRQIFRSSGFNHMIITICITSRGKFHF